MVGDASSAGLTKTGSGTLTLSGNNTLTGTTAINAGTLIAANANAFGTGALDLNGGNLTLNQTTNASSFLMGSGIWNLNLVGAPSTSLSGTSTFSILGGTLNLGGGAINYGNSYNILTGFSGGSVSGLSFTNYDSANWTPSLSTGGTLSFSAIPEPTSALAGALLGLGLLRRRR